MHSSCAINKNFITETLFGVQKNNQFFSVPKLLPEKLCDYFLNDTKLCTNVCLILVPNEKINQQVKHALKRVFRNLQNAKLNQEISLL